MPKMVFLQPLRDMHRNMILELAPEWEIIDSQENEDWKSHLKEAQIICGWNEEAERACLQPDTSIRWVHNWGAGVDKIPVVQLAERGIALTNSSGVHPYPISETVFAMMLSFTRKLHIYIRQQLEHKWHHAGVRSEMHGKTIGIVGVGAIGGEIARLAKAFGMRVLGLRRTAEPHPEVDKMYGNDGLNELLRHSDYVVVTVPLTDETYHMFGDEQFRQMKETAFFVNIGRGKTVDTEALIRALKERRIAGAGLDVFEQEPLPADHPLWEMENVIITPHSSGSTEHYHDRAIGLFLQNLRLFVQGKEPSVNRVRPDLKY